MQGLGRGWDLYNGEQIQRLQESCRHTGIAGCSCRLDWTLTGTVMLWSLWRKGQRKRSWKEICVQECSDIINKYYLLITVSPVSKFQSTSSFIFSMFNVTHCWSVIDGLASVNRCLFPSLYFLDCWSLYFSEFILCIYPVDASFHHHNSVSYNPADGHQPTLQLILQIVSPLKPHFSAAAAVCTMEADGSWVW